MKKRLFILCTFVATLISLGQLRAQQTQGELSLMISDAIPTTVIFSIADDLIPAIAAGFQGYTLETGDKSTPGLISIRYVRDVNRWLSVGGDVGFMHFSRDAVLTSNNGSKPDEYVDRKTTLWLIMPTGKFHYMQRKKVSLYGSLGVGALFANRDESSGALREKDSFTTVSFQVNPIGIRIGERLGGFAELGFGMKGFAALGVTMKL